LPVKARWELLSSKATPQVGGEKPDKLAGHVKRADAHAMDGFVSATPSDQGARPGRLGVTSRECVAHWCVKQTHPLMSNAQQNDCYPRTTPFSPFPDGSRLLKPEPPPTGQWPLLASDKRRMNGSFLPRFTTLTEFCAKYYAPFSS